MKKVFSFLFLLAIAVGSVQAQDIITKKNGENVQAKILEINQNDVKYKRWDNLEGPVFTLSKSDILSVKYQNGTSEIFKNEELSQAAAAGQVVPGMKYRKYKKLYNHKDYERKPGDRRSPVAGGLCSWVIPGLGQWINGEVGRGFGYFGGSLACAGVAAVGMVVLLDDHQDPENVLYSSIVLAAGLASLLTVDICAIVDGVRVAKIKNMYERDIRQLASSDFSVNLEPYFATTAGMGTGIGNQPIAVGASIKVRF